MHLLAMLDTVAQDQPNNLVEPTELCCPIRAEDHIGLVRMVALLYWKGRRGEVLEDSDIYSDGMMGLAKAVNAFRPDCGAVFSTYAVWVIDNTIKNGLRDKNRKMRSGEVQPLSQDPCWQDETIIPVDDLLRELLRYNGPSDEHSRNLSLVKAYYLEGTPIKALASQYGVSHQSIYNRINKAISQIRQDHSSLVEDWT